MEGEYLDGRKRTDAEGDWVELAGKGWAGSI